MISKLQFLLDWSEVWAPLIPMVFYLFNRHQPAYLKPVVIYLCIAFFFNLVGDVISDYKRYLPSWMQSNNPLYNIHSIVRFICFGYFFLLLRQNSFSQMKKILPGISLMIILFNFIYLENFGNPEHLSGNLLAAEAYFLLIYCILYYLAKLRDEDGEIGTGPDFWVVTGLGIYVVVNFFVFLFYVPMIDYDSLLAERIWNVHNVAYIILCLFITKAFYVSARYKFAV